MERNYFVANKQKMKQSTNTKDKTSITYGQDNLKKLPQKTD